MNNCPSKRQVRHQGGVALLIAMIVLVGLSLAGIALVRSVDTTSLVAGNLAFRNSATLGGDQGIEAARSWLVGNSGALNADSPGNGYYATSQDSLDVTGNETPGNAGDDVSWPGTTGGIATPKCLASSSTTGNTVCYIIHRLCDTSGALDASKCSTQQTVKGGSSMGAGRPMSTYQQPKWNEVAALAYYRVTVRISGPRNTVSFVQGFIII